MTVAVKQIAVLGSTGSIGRQTLDVVRSLAPRFNVVALAARQNLDLLRKQIKEFQPRYVYCEAEKALAGAGTSHEPLSLEEIARHEQIDTIVIATSGKSGLLATLAAVQTGKNVAQFILFANSIATGSDQLIVNFADHRVAEKRFVGQAEIGGGVIVCPGSDRLIDGVARYA